MSKRATPLYEVEGMTKQDVHDQLVAIVRLAAETHNSMRTIFIAKGGTVDVLRGEEADRIVRSLAGSDSAYAWPQYDRFFTERGIDFHGIVNVYRRMSWKRGARSGPRITRVA